MKLLLNDREAKELINSNPRNPFRRTLVNDVSVKIKTQVCCAKTGKVIKDNPFRKNLVYDAGLNAMARSTFGTTTLRCGPASIARACRIGDSTSAVKIVPGGVTFTQAGTTVTASSNFFTAAMVGAILKYGASGSAGAEYYISAFISATQVTVDTSATVGSATAATVWMVQQNTMGNLLFTSTTYQTNAGDCVTNIVGNVVSHQRTFTFPVQAAPYNVNEVGYGPQSVNNQVCGRIVLPSTDVVGTSNFYRVIIVVSVTYTPNVPTAVGNIGVNWNTAGNAMLEYWSIAGVDSSGNLNGTVPNALYASLDACSEYSGFLGTTSGGCQLIAKIAATYTQNATPQTTFTPNWGTQNTNYILVDTNQRQWTFTGTRGSMKLTFTGNASTTGQTCYGIGISPSFNADPATNRGKPFFDVLFTTPQALPNGSWLPSIEITQVYSRTLVN